MKKFARCVLILIFVIIVSGACGYFYEDKTLTTMYTSTTQLYVVPGEENEATVRAVNGGLKDDFIIVFKSNVVIQEAQRIAGTSEDIASYLTVYQSGPEYGKTVCGCGWKDCIKDNQHYSGKVHSDFIRRNLYEYTGEAGFIP